MPKKIKKPKPLTKTELAMAAANSDNPSVIKAWEKVRFVVEMSHTKEELHKLKVEQVRHIQAVFEDNGEYKRFLFEWCGEEFTIYKNGNALQAGEGTDSNSEPVLTYILDRN